MKLNGYSGTITPRADLLYGDGATDYRILIPQNATEAEAYAAQELTAIFALAGVTIETVTDEGITADNDAKFIAIGNTVYFKALGMELLPREFKFDGFIIETLGSTHIIKGVGETGTGFGTYGFAEYAMGWRYYHPEEQKVEARAQNLEFHIKDIPTFYCRSPYSYLVAHKPDHAYRFRVNGQFSRREAKHGEGTPWSVLHDQSLALQILDYKKYRADHPDWFYLPAEKEGVKGPQGYPQICFSKGLLSDAEGGFFDTFLANLLEFIKAQPEKPYVMLGISDNGFFCNCPLCQKNVEKYTKSGLNMLFVNKVADAVEAWRRENCPQREYFIITFAYQASFDAPVTWEGERPVPVAEGVVARDNVIVRYAPIRANYCYDLLDKDHNLSSRQALLGWSSISKHLSVWDYRSDFGTQTFPYPTTVTAQANQDIFMEYGMVDVFNQGQHFTGGQMFQQMDDFARARMHWNGKESYDELCDEFRKAYYKEAEPFVTEYLRFVESQYPLWESRGWSVRINNRASIRKHYFTPEEMYQHKAILDKALAAAKSKKIYDRVNELTIFYKFVLVLCFPLEIPKQEALSLIENLYALTEKAEMPYFLRLVNTTEEVLEDARNIILGVYPEEERKFKLKKPEDGPF